MAAMSPSIATSSQRLGMADIVDRDIVVLAPEERHGGRTSRACPSMLRAAVWPWRSATTQCSTRMAVAAVRIGPARDIAGREDARHAGFEVRHSPTMPRSTASPACSARAIARAHADAGHDEIRFEPAATRQASPAPHRCRSPSCPEVEDDAVLLVQRTHEIAHLRPEDALHAAAPRAPPHAPRCRARAARPPLPAR